MLAYLFVRLIIPIASAARIETLGSGKPGIDAMWGKIKGVFPHDGVGAGGVALIATKVINFVLMSIGGVGVAMLIYAGIKIITGGEEGLSEGKKIATYAIVGIILAMLASAAVNFTYVMIMGMSS